MRTLSEIRKILNDHRPVLEEKYKVREIALFGSYARGDQDETSDIDILVKFREPVGFLFIHLADFLEEILCMPVDLVTEDAIKPNRRKSIEEDLVHV